MDLKVDIGVNEVERALRRFHLREPRLVRLEEQTIHICHLNFVVVEEDQLADPAAGEHFRCHAPNPTDTNHLR
jgi:hypothetical protein